MLGYALRKLMALPGVVLVVSFLVFVAVRQLPGDPARLLAGPAASAAAVASIHHALGLDRPISVQYFDFLCRALGGDLGSSIQSRLPVAQEIGNHAPFTIALALVAYVVATFCGVVGGTAAAVRRNGWWDRVFSGATILAVSTANFWFGLMAMEVFAVRLGWLPLMGAGTAAHIVLPALTLALAPFGLIGRMTQASMIKVLGQDYIRTARAKGLGQLTIYGRHALRNALTPIVTIIGLNLGSVIGGAVVTETVFSWPGLGRLLVESVKYRDYPVIQGITLIAVIAVVLMNLSADILIALLNPKMQRS